MAIQANKPVYVFDQDKKQWFTKQPGEDWKQCDTPILTKNFAGIGTREINQYGKDAIRSIYIKTFGGSNPINIYDDTIDILENDPDFILTTILYDAKDGKSIQKYTVSNETIYNE